MSEERTKILELLANNKITVSEAEQLIKAVEESSKKAGQEERPQFLCIRIEGESKVNIRIPLQLIRSGIKFASLIPHDVSHHVSDRLRGHGIDLDRIDPDSLDSLIKELKNFSIDVEEKDEKVKIYCE